MKTSSFLLTLAFAGMIFFSCSETVGNADESNAANGITAFDENSDLKSTEVAGVCTTCDFTGTLTKEEIDGLMEMREEEKLAHDVYVTFYKMYKFKIFDNISKSETAHTSSVLYVINGFKLTDPTPAAATKFSNPLFTDLYAQLTKKGAVSLVEALKVGAFIEEYDIADLKRLIEETKNPTIAKVYGNLLRGSYFHLTAYTNALKFKGVIYTPTILSAEEYKDILDN